ncbi:hypothetical protein [uncultured Gilliamella sp.]|uniref:hypothetical protein n=1 Tax=uncultured Gilliamella sp. TaxID=1193505 RepID=UPI0025D430EE|nr:hypothetical protein [uncultured Gilliamella sp.]
MQKKIKSILFATCLSITSMDVLALMCTDNPSQNVVLANNYILKVDDFIDTPAKGIKQETRTLQYNNGLMAKQIIDYDEKGLFTQSQYDLYLKNNQLDYTESLQKKDFGWQTIIENQSDKTHTIINFKVDAQGKIIESEQIKKSDDFVFSQNDSYQFDNNNCLVRKQITWKIEDVEAKHNNNVDSPKGDSTYTFTYENQHLRDVSYNSTGRTSRMDHYSYLFDHLQRLKEIKLNTLSADAKYGTVITEFSGLNDKNDWLHATVSLQNVNQLTTVRTITYY